MASSGNVTTTAPIGPGLTATAQQITGFRELTFKPSEEIMSVMESDGRVVDYEYNTIATVTYVIASGVATVTVST